MVMSGEVGLNWVHMRSGYVGVHLSREVVKIGCESLIQRAIRKVGNHPSLIQKWSSGKKDCLVVGAWHDTQRLWDVEVCMMIGWNTEQLWSEVLGWCLKLSSWSQWVEVEYGFTMLGLLCDKHLSQCLPCLVTSLSFIYLTKKGLSTRNCCASKMCYFWGLQIMWLFLAIPDCEWAAKCTIFLNSVNGSEGSDWHFSTHYHSSTISWCCTEPCSS